LKKNHKEKKKGGIPFYGTVRSAWGRTGEPSRKKKKTMSMTSLRILREEKERQRSRKKAHKSDRSCLTKRV